MKKYIFKHISMRTMESKHESVIRRRSTS